MNNIAIHPSVDTDSMTRLLLSDIRLEPGFNPRLYINEESESFKELCSTITSQGVIEPIIVRPCEDGGYSLIAGERRYRASANVGLADIPVVIKHVDADAALEIALVENSAREDVSPVEEAESAHKLMDKYDGNREEVMARLGWNKQKLDRRLLLIHAVTDVRMAFLKGRIPLGMVELLAGIPSESQAGTMAAAIEKKLTVAELKSRLDAATEHLQLDKALFDKSDCANCQHNSSVQLGLFSESITEGRCMNRSCFGEKTKDALEIIKDQLAEKYNAVFLDTEKQQSSFSQVMATGPGGLGVEQFTQCKGCANFGAMLSTAPGREGSVTDEVCFNTACMAEKVALMHAPVSSEHSTEQGAEADVAKDKKTTPKTPKPTKLPSMPTVASTPSKVIEAVDAFYRGVAKDIVAGSASVRLAIAAYAMWVDTGRAFDLSAYETDEVNMGSRNRDELVGAFCRLPIENLALMVSEMALYIAGHRKDEFSDKSLIKTAVSIVKVTNTDLTGKFNLSADFLKAHTKAGIEALLTEAKTEEGQSFPDWYNAKKESDKAFKKMLTMKVDELVAEVIGIGFDFSTFVPSAVSSRL